MGNGILKNGKCYQPFLDEIGHFKKQLNDLEYILEFCAGSGIRTHYIWIS